MGYNRQQMRSLLAEVAEAEKYHKDVIQLRARFVERWLATYGEKETALRMVCDLLRADVADAKNAVDRAKFEVIKLSES